MNVDLLKSLLIIALSVSIISTTFIQKLKSLPFITNKKYVVYISFAFSMILGILFSLSFTDIKVVESIWVGFFSFIGADTLYLMLEDKVFKSFSSIKNDEQIIEISRDEEND